MRKVSSLLFISTIIFLKTLCIIYLEFEKFEIKFSIPFFFWRLRPASAYPKCPVGHREEEFTKVCFYRNEYFNFKINQTTKKKTNV